MKGITHYYILIVLCFLSINVFAQTTGGGPNEDCPSEAKLHQYVDLDGDGYGAGVVVTRYCELAPGHSETPGDCDDYDPDVNIPKNWYVDRDGDGLGSKTEPSYFACYKRLTLDGDSINVVNYVPNNNDCDDTTFGTTENTYYKDTDGDGYGSKHPDDILISCDPLPSGYSVNNYDHNDTNPLIIDIPLGTNCPTQEKIAMYVDRDRDGIGIITLFPTLACGILPDGYSYQSGDCDDTNPEIQSIFLYEDTDGDGFGDPTTKFNKCERFIFDPSIYVTNGDDCNDNNLNIHNGTYVYLDKDGDGYGTKLIRKKSCSEGNGYVFNNDDCDDSDGAVNPNNRWYSDEDHDGYGDPDTHITSCEQPEGYVANKLDLCPDQGGGNKGCPVPGNTPMLSNRNYIRQITPLVPLQLVNDNTISLINSNDKVTYFDDRGRKEQSIDIGAGGQQQDIISHYQYDALGKETKTFLPYTDSKSSNKAYRYNAKLGLGDFFNTAKYENTTNPYSESIFEPSPLNRVLEQGAPGQAWKANPTSDSDHTIKFDWDTNAAEEVFYFKVNFTNGNTETPTLFKDGYYDPEELYVTITKDENWTINDGDNHTIKEYVDKYGRVVLKRTYASTNLASSEAHDTYYVYDDFGNLTYVIPPKVILSPTDGVSTTELNELCYQYRYDERNRLVEKKIPGKGWEYIVYNKLDQPVMTQDANQKPKKEWLFTKYDALGRVAFTGLHLHPSVISRITMQGYSDNNNYTQWTNKTEAPTVLGGTQIYYSNGPIPTGISEIYTINYYDNYTFDHNVPNPGTVYNQTVTTNAKGLLTGIKARVLDTNNWITTVTYYDEKGRPIYVYNKNDYLGTIDITETKLDFTGKVEESKTTHIKGNNAPIVTIDKFDYDHIGRLLTQKQKINNQAEEMIAHNVYDELGQLEQKKVGNAEQAPLQTIDYTYNVRGWLSAINEGNTVNGDLFGFKINYNNPQHGVEALFNGNISETKWKTANDNTLRWYKYSYDALNRITAAEDNSGNFELRQVNYDKNGNIKGFIRIGYMELNEPFRERDYDFMDWLNYEYNTGNKLLKVTDIAGKKSGFKDGTNINHDYEYDINGNMIIDRNKGITGISYNHLNLPTSVTVNNTEDNGNIQYIYDATGAKLKKIATEGSSLTTTEYAGKYIYKNNQLQFFNTSEGYVEPDGNTWKYIYQYKDHLGNIRLSYADNDNDGKIDVVRNATDIDGDGDLAMEIREEKNYYPFGLTHKGYNDTQRGTPHYYGFGGKEEQNELGLGWIDITARNYNPELGRWMNLDPLAELMTRHSPYNYAFDNPIFFIDPDGNMPCPNGCGGNSNDAVPSTPDQNLRTAVVRKAKSLWNTIGFLANTPASVSVPLIMNGIFTENFGNGVRAAQNGDIKGVGEAVLNARDSSIDQIAAAEGISRGNAAGVWSAGIALDVGLGLATDGVLSGLGKGAGLVDDVVTKSTGSLARQTFDESRSLVDGAEFSGAISGEGGAMSVEIDLLVGDVTGTNTINASLIQSLESIASENGMSSIKVVGNVINETAAAKAAAAYIEAGYSVSTKTVNGATQLTRTKTFQ